MVEARITMNHHAMLRHNVFHRRLERTEPVYTVFFFAFGAAILFVSCSMSRNYRRAQREEAARLEEEERLEEEKTFKLVEKRRAQLRNAFLRKDLAKVLRASNFKRLSSDQADDTENTESSTTFDDDESDREFTTSISPVSQGEDDGKIDDMESGKETDGIGQIPDTNMNNENPCMDIEQNDTMASDLEEIELFTGKNSPVSVPITCPICLEHYKEGDTVVLSGNPSCTHVFHQHCILDYLVRHDEGTSPCPCCRQVFLPKEFLKGGWKKKASPGRSE